MRLYCANNNTLYPSVLAASRDLNIDRIAIYKHLHGERNSVGNYVFMKLDDVSPDKVRAARAWLLYNAYKIILDCDDAPIIYGKKVVNYYDED